MKINEKLAVIGVGRLGLCFCLSLEDAGFDVIGCDIVEDYVEQINQKSISSHEPGVNELIKNSKNFIATTDIKKTIDHARLIFVTVATYSEQDGRYDVSQVDSVVNSLKSLGYQNKQKHLIICSNVNPGYSDIVYDQLKSLNWQVSFNPETIAQGTILKNQREPDCVYIGSDSEFLSCEIRNVYDKMCTNTPRIFEMDRLSAELTKVSMNCFLTCKISFANMVGDLATKIGANPNKVLAAVGGDTRINNKFFKYGFGWGGPCFPRDTRALIHLATNNNVYHDMCSASNNANRNHLEFQVNQFIESGQKKYITNCVTYKPGTTILEESQQLKFAVELAKRGIEVVVNESEPVVNQLKEIYGDLFIYE